MEAVEDWQRPMSTIGKVGIPVEQERLQMSPAEFARVGGISGYQAVSEETS